MESEIVALGQPGDAITAAQFTGEEAPPASYFEGLVAAICRRWLEDGRPKVIVRVPPMQGGKSGELVRRLKRSLRGSNGSCPSSAKHRRSWPCPKTNGGRRMVSTRTTMIERNPGKGADAP